LLHRADLVGVLYLLASHAMPVHLSGPRANIVLPAHTLYFNYMYVLNSELMHGIATVCPSTSQGLMMW
jgi:hypothetical protein